jgi:hypothetical protein
MYSVFLLLFATILFFLPGCSDSIRWTMFVGFLPFVYLVAYIAGPEDVDVDLEIRTCHQIIG